MIMEKIKIVFTDRDTVSSGDLDLTCFEKYGELTFYGETAPELTAERIKDADVIVINKTLIGKAELDAAKKLKLICLFATGYNNVDVVYARSLGITVCNAGVYSTDAVAQQVFGYILADASKIAEYDRDVKNGEWIKSRLFCFFSMPTHELRGKTLGIFGYGAIGKRVCEIAKAFSMRVIVCTRTPKKDEGVEFVDFDTLLAQSDYLTVHCPLNEGTKEKFDAAAFAKCKSEMYFINTSRGGVIVETALADALKSGQLRGAAIDVLTKEPMQKDCVLFDCPNITITPHVAWAPIETRARLVSIVESNIRDFLSGHPSNVVN